MKYFIVFEENLGFFFHSIHSRFLIMMMPEFQILDLDTINCYSLFILYPQVLEREKIMKRFQEVTAQLEQALSEISFEKLDISDEVREQVHQSSIFFFRVIFY